MVNHCVVRGCGAYRTGENNGFYSIPTVHKRTDEKSRMMMQQRRSNWLDVLMLRDPPQHVRVCGRHFVSGQPAALFDVLSKDWIPSLHLPSQSDVPGRKKPKYAEPNDVPEDIPVASPSSSSSSNFHQRMATSSSVDDTCRLCLDPTVESYTTIENPAMKNILENVFCFPIEFKEGLTSSVCQICSNTITEFYEYSEKVRQHQTLLEAAATKLMLAETPFPAVDIKIELDSDTELQEILTIEPPLAPLNDSSRHAVGQFPKTKEQLTELADGPDFIDKMLRKKKEDENDKYIREHITLSCELCGAVTPTFRELRYHFLDEHQRQDAYTRCCGKKLRGKPFLLEHIRYHLDSNAFRCEECEKAFTTEKALEVHKAAKHSNDRIHKCNRCPRAYANLVLLKSHMERHAKHECPKCRRCFLSKPALDEHMKCHMPRPCPECHKVFVNRVTLKVHMANVHDKANQTQNYVCDQCGMNFTRLHVFKRHMNHHAGIEVPKIQCKICGRTLKEPYYKNHMKTVHGNRERVHECDICHRMYPHPIALQNHKSKAHIEPRHQCEVCGKTFISKARWLDHLTSHTGAMKHSCEYCGALYRTRTTTLKHIRVKHPVEWAEKKQSYLKLLPEAASPEEAAST